MDRSSNSEGAVRPVLGALRRAPVHAEARVLWWVLAGAAVAVLVTARALHPDPAGHGTHTQLGLPPCGFLLWTGLPCPGCGLTTSFAHMARFEWVLAATAHPLGIPLFVLTAAAVPVSLSAAAQGHGLGEVFDRYRGTQVVLVLAGAALLVWVTRLLTLIVA